MNERIIELADKAVEDVSSGPWNISDEFCIKFARLIVQEFRQVVAVEIETNCKPSEEWGFDDWEQGYVAGMWAATRFMKAHLGIEEYEKT
jgi:hypothetical protein